MKAAEHESRVESDDWPTFFTMVPEWLTFAPITDRAHRIYTVLAAHLRRDTGSRTTGVIVQADLAAVVGLSSNPERVRKYIAELEELHAVKVIEDWDAVRKIPITRYVVRFNAPPGYAGHVRVQSWQDERRTARTARISKRREAEDRRKSKEKPAQPVTRKSEGHDDRKPEGHDDRKSEGPSTDETSPDEASSDTEAPSARSAPDARRATTGSSGRASGGCAASGKTNPASGKAGGNGQVVRLTREQAAAVRMVEAALPAELVALLPAHRLPVVRDAILAALDSRTPEQLAARVRRRWHEHGYAGALHSADGRGLDSPVGVVVALVRSSTDCPDPMCEDTVTVDTGADCRACAERRVDRRTDRKVGPVPARRERSGRPVTAGRGPQVECEGDGGMCGRPAAPDRDLCPHCENDNQGAASSDEEFAALLAEASRRVRETAE